MNALRALLPALLVLIMGSAALAACEAELRQLDAGLPPGMPPGSRAAQLLFGAVELLEPTLPAWHYNGVSPLGPGEAGQSAVSWLLGRDLLPDDWDRDSLESETWQEMLERFLAWYGLTPTRAELRLSGGEDPVRDLAAILDEAAAAVRPVAIIAHEDSDVLFAGILWNWTAYPRLLVRRLPPGLSVRDGPDEVLTRLGNCALTVEDYALAPVETAWQLFAGTGDADMYVLSSDPERPAWPTRVGREDVRSWLDFSAEEVNGTVGFSAAFDGQELGLAAVLDIVMKIRTNIPALRVARYLEIPGR